MGLAHSNLILLHTLTTFSSLLYYGSRVQRYVPQIDLALTRLPEDPGQLLVRSVLPALVVILEEIYGEIASMAE
jgi:hypothetical protein